MGARKFVLPRIRQLVPYRIALGDISRPERSRPAEDLQAVIDGYPQIETCAWVQEEPRNMGARKFVLPRIRQLVPYKIALGDISRPERSRPAEGYPATLHAEQARIVREALTGR